MQANPKLSTTPPLPGVVAVPALNDALQTIATDFSGDTDPAALAWPFSKWADTSTGLLKRRNAAGTEWVVEGSLFRRALNIIPSDQIPTSDIGLISTPSQGMMEWDGSRYVAKWADHGQCRFVYVSQTECRLMPCNGNGLIINGRQYRIDPAGIPLSPSGLVPAQTYYAYAKDNGFGGMALEPLLASANGHSAGADGVEIKTGDRSRTLVGMFWLDGDVKFLSSSTFDFVASWFNQTDKMVTNIVNNSTTASIDAPLTGNIGLLTWGSTLLSGEYLGRVSNTAIAFSSANIHVGGIVAAGMSVINRTPGDASMILSLNRVKSISDGPMYSDVWGAVTNGAGSYTGNYRLMGRA